MSESVQAKVDDDVAGCGKHPNKKLDSFFLFLFYFFFYFAYTFSTTYAGLCHEIKTHIEHTKFRLILKIFVWQIFNQKKKKIKNKYNSPLTKIYFNEKNRRII